jgi:hypothetical protein
LLVAPFVQNPAIYQRLDALFKHWKGVEPAQRMADEKCQAFNKIIKFSKHPALISLKEEVSKQRGSVSAQPYPIRLGVGSLKQPSLDRLTAATAPLHSCSNLSRKSILTV